MNKHSIDDRITALAPMPEHLDQEWANATLARILADDSSPKSRWRAPRRLTSHRRRRHPHRGTGAAVAAATMDDPIDVVRDTLLDFADDPDTSGNDVGTIHDPQLVAKVERSNGHVFGVWIATTSSGEICDAQTVSDSTWDGVGAPAPSDLEYGCASDIVDPTDPDKVIRRERPDQVGGFFFREGGDTILYGISPYSDAVAVRVEGQGVDRTLPLRADSLGYGAALPEATGMDSLELTFLDSAGKVVGSRTAYGRFD